MPSRWIAKQKFARAIISRRKVLRALKVAVLDGMEVLDALLEDDVNVGDEG